MGNTFLLNFSLNKVSVGKYCVYFVLLGLLAELVEQQPATRCVMGSIPVGSALEVWPWTSV
jgi:hypothetical protein